MLYSANQEMILETIPAYIFIRKKLQKDLK